MDTLILPTAIISGVALGLVAARVSLAMIIGLISSGQV